MAENTSTNVQESEEEAVVAAASELVNASQAKKCGPVTDTDAVTAGEAEEEESDPADTDGQAAAAVSAESEQDHRELKDYSESGWIETDADQDEKCGPVTDTDADMAGEAEEEESDPADTGDGQGQGQGQAAAAVNAESEQDHRELKDTESGWIETDADQDDSAMSNPATTDQSKTENESKSSESDRNVNATQEVKKHDKVKLKLVKLDPETEAREIFNKFLKRLYGDHLKLVLSASYKKRIISYLQEQLPLADQTSQLKTHVKQYQYVLVDADKVSKEFITSSGDDSSIIMPMDHSDPDGQSGEQTEKILMRPHYKTKELVPAPSQSEMYDLIEQCHLSTENHVGFEHTFRLLQKKYGCIPQAAVRKYISMCRGCQMKKGNHTTRYNTPRQLKAKEWEKQRKADQREKKQEWRRRTEEEKRELLEQKQETKRRKEEGKRELLEQKQETKRRKEEEKQELLEQKQRKIEERQAAAEERKIAKEMKQLERELEKEMKEKPGRKRTQRDEDLMEENKKRPEERKRLKALEATRKRLEREKERKGVAAKESPVKRGKKGEGVAAKKLPVKRGKKGEGVAAKKSPVNRGKKGEGDSAERSPVKRKASAKETTTRKKVKATETKAKTKKSRISPTTLVQYVILPGDVFHAEDFTTNQAVIQACHARTAVLQLFKDDENVIKYTSDFDAMHTEILETEDEEEMEVISDELKSKNVDHILWMKSATNMATCIATKPYPKKTVQRHFKDLTQFLTE